MPCDGAKDANQFERLHDAVLLVVLNREAGKEDLSARPARRTWVSELVAAALPRPSTPAVCSMK